MLLSPSWDKVRFSWLKACPLDSGVRPSAVGLKSGVLLAESMGLSPLRRGVDVRESAKSLCSPLGVFTAEKELLAGVAEGMGAEFPLTGVKLPALTAVNPEEITGRGSSGGVGTASSCSDAFNAAEARIAGEPRLFAGGVPWADFFSGECAGDGVNGPPCSTSSICCTPGFTTRRYSSYGCNHF